MQLFLFLILLSMKNILQSSYYRSDIPAVKQFANPTREVLSLKTNDIQGFSFYFFLNEELHITLMNNN